MACAFYLNINEGQVGVRMRKKGPRVMTFVCWRRWLLFLYGNHSILRCEVIKIIGSRLTHPRGFLISAVRTALVSIIEDNYTNSVSLGWWIGSICFWAKAHAAACREIPRFLLHLKHFLGFLAKFLFGRAHLLEFWWRTSFKTHLEILESKRCCWGMRVAVALDVNCPHYHRKRGRFPGTKSHTREL